MRLLATGPRGFLPKFNELYIISEGPDGPVKIGRSMNAGARLIELQTGNPRKLRFVGRWQLEYEAALSAERELQGELELWRMQGEWFALSEQFMLDYVPDFLLSNGWEKAA